MALLERVVALLRANVTEMVAKAENPEVMVAQLLRDMENQLIQVKTQLAMALADQHVLERKREEHGAGVTLWRGRAEAAVARGEEAMARGALERMLGEERMVDGFCRQLVEQEVEAGALRENYRRLEAKLSETRGEAELLRARLRAARGSAAGAGGVEAERTMAALREELTEREARRAAARAVQADGAGSLEEKFAETERREKVEALLEELKQRPKMLAG